MIQGEYLGPLPFIGRDSSDSPGDALLARHPPTLRGPPKSVRVQAEGSYYILY